jgi:hypothetical protein
VALVALGGGQPVQLQPLQDPPHASAADLHLVVALAVPRDPGRAEVVVLAQVEDLAHDLDVGRPGRTSGRLDRSRSPSTPWAWERRYEVE